MLEIWNEGLVVAPASKILACGASVATLFAQCVYCPCKTEIDIRPMLQMCLVKPEAGRWNFEASRLHQTG